jgi:beta-N-acetylhexosaminidase
VTAQQHVARMTLREKCAQLVFFAHPFGEDDPDRTSQLVRKYGAGGIVIAGGSKFDLPSFVNWAQKVAKFPMLALGDYADGAGPQVSGATAFPAAGNADAAQTKGRHIGAEARALGVRMTLGVAASDPCARSLLDGFHYSKLAVCVRGFPGPGAAELAAEADAILVGNEKLTDVDEDTPACLSRAVIQGTLRREYRFEGLLFIDAAAPPPGGPEVLEQAVNAGIDAILAPPDPIATIDALEAATKAGRIAESNLDRAATRLLLRKERMGLFADRLVDVAQVEQIVGAAAHQAAAARMAGR